MKQLLRASLLCCLGWVALLAHAEEQTWKVQLKEADIRAFVAQVSDITGYSFVIDPRVKGKVTVISNTPMARDDVYEMFLSVLQVHGFTAIPSGDVIKIVQETIAKSSSSDVDLLDRVPREQLVTRVIKVKNTTALELVPILRPMVAKYGHLAGVADANALVISDHANNIDRLIRIIGSLDTPSNEGLDVIAMRDAWVGDVVRLVEELAPAELAAAGGAARGGGGRNFKVLADERSNRLIVRGDAEFRAKMRELVEKLDQPVNKSGTTRVLRLKHADAAAVVEILNGLVGQVTQEDGSTTNNPNANFAIFADEALNSIVVRASPTVLNEIEDIVRELDIRRAQVLIEAAIVEIGEDTLKAAGTQIAAGNSDFASGPVAGSSFDTVGNSISSFIGSIAASTADGGTATLPSLVSGLTLATADPDDDFAVLIQILDSVTGVNLLSTPSIITMDNQEAEIVVGQSIPFITGQTTTTGAGTTTPFQTIERQDIGITLRVTPSISEGDLVRLDIFNESSSLAPSVETASDLITNNRQITTTVLADNNETIVLGGLIQEDYTTSISKVPLLGDLPLIGYLFRSKERTRDKSNLFVFLKPTILRSRESATQVTKVKYDGLWEVNLQINGELGKEDGVEVEYQRPEIDGIFHGNQFKLPEQRP